MKRAIAAFVLVVSALLSACSGAPEPAATAVQTPIETYGPPVTPPTASAPPVTHADPPPAQAPVQPAPSPQETPVLWYSPGIGLPLRSHDPRAGEKKVVMLTFDDGPTAAGHTARILDVLAREQVKAMFFITGTGARTKDLLERIHKEGHVLAVHGVSHTNLKKLPPAEQRKEIEPQIQLIQEVTGAPPRYFRPPYGAYNDDLLALVSEYKMELINWTAGAMDWEGLDQDGYKDPALVVKDVLGQLHPGAVVLLHDTKRHTADALPDLIREIRAAGYEFVVLP